MATTPPLRPGLWIALLASAALGAIVLALLGPRVQPLGPPRGDPTLAAEAAAVLGSGNGCGVVSIVRIRDGQVTWAGFGDVSPASRFELGSITKTFDGLLLADAAQRGEVRLDDPLAKHLTETSGSEVGTVTLTELATHRGGLPTVARLDLLAVKAETLANKALSAFTAATPESVIRDARQVKLSGRGTTTYSNLGTALLGFALARAAGLADWSTYVRVRLFEPLGMSETQIAENGRPAPDLLTPHQANGEVTEPWTSTGYAPAGVGVTTTTADLTKYAQALLDGEAPGLDALRPLGPGILGQRIGLAWMVSDVGGHDVAWHVGATAGMRTMLAVDPGRHQATIILTNAANDVTGVALMELAGATGVLLPPPPFNVDTVPFVFAGAQLVLLFALTALHAESRWPILGAALAAQGGLLIWGISAPWDWAPPWTLGLAAGLTVGALVASGLRWSGLPWLPPRRRPMTIVGLALGAVWLAAMLAFAGWVAILHAVA